MAEDFDPTQLSDLEILSLPESNVPAGKLDAFLARRAEVIEKQETGQTALALDPAHDARQRPDRTIKKQEEQISLQRYLVAMQDIRDREDELIEEIEVEHRETLRRLKDIDAHAIKLRDGRRAYVDGDEFRDRHGILLRGADRREADRLKTKTSSTWAEESEWEKRSDLELGVLHNLRENRQKLDDTLNNSAKTTATERAEILKQEKPLLARYEIQTRDLMQSYSTDYADAYETKGSGRTAASYASTLDGAKNAPTVAPDFSAAATGQAPKPETQDLKAEPPAPALTPTGP